MRQQLLADVEEKLVQFRKYVSEVTTEHLIGPEDIVNMDEVPLIFDLPLTRIVGKKDKSSISVKTTGHDFSTDLLTTIISNHEILRLTGSFVPISRVSWTFTRSFHEVFHFIFKLNC